MVFRNLRFEEDRNSFKTAWDFCGVNRAIHPETPKDRIPTIDATIENTTATGVKPFIEGNASFSLRLAHVACRGPFMSIKGTADTKCSLAVSGGSLGARDATSRAGHLLRRRHLA